MKTGNLAIILSAFAAQLHARGQDSMDEVAGRLVDKLVAKLSGLDFQNTDMENTTLGKPGQLAMPNAQSNFVSAPLASLTGGQARAVPNVRPRRQCKQLRSQQMTQTRAMAAAFQDWQHPTPMCAAPFGAHRSQVTAKATTLESPPADTAETPTASRNDLRNIAIVAHVDHGKTTLVDAMIQSSGALDSRTEIGKDDRLMDNNDQEKERGITILAKNAAIDYKGTKINIVDTPGHADFGGEVERVLNMVDGVLLLVDAREGPKPQTRFVLKKALSLGLKILVVVNKIDKPAARPDYVIDKTFDLFCELGATDEQTDFPIVYASAINRIAGDEPFGDMKDMTPLFEQILDLPKPPCNPDGPLQLQISSITSDNFIGRLGIGRIKSGTVKKNSVVGLSAGPGEEVKQVKVGELFDFDAMGRKPVEEARAGEIVVFSGITDFNIGDTIVAMDDPQPLPPMSVEQPTMSITFSVNKSPFAGKVGKKLTSRQIRDRLDKELEVNVALKVEDTQDGDTYLVSGRGLLHLTVLIETMRREGFELMVGCPQVIETEVDGERHEPFELVDIEVPDEFSGSVIQALNNKKGCMQSMTSSGGDSNLVSIQYEVPSRGMTGVKSQLLSATRGLVVMTTTFAGYRPYAGDFPGRENGNLLSQSTGTATTNAIANAQQRGTLFSAPQDEVYENQIIGINSREQDMKMNICRTKTLDNMRSAGKDDTIKIVPAKQLTLEEAVEYIVDGEYVEVTPDSLRMGSHAKKVNKAPR
jgi:GTP-binding protein